MSEAAIIARVTDQDGMVTAYVLPATIEMWLVEWLERNAIQIQYSTGEVSSVREPSKSANASYSKI